MTDKQRLNALRRALTQLKMTKRGYASFDPEEDIGVHWKLALNDLEALAADLKPKVGWAGIGPITKGGASLLDMSLTHKTSGIPLFPAVDLAWGAGVPLYAPESLVIDTKDTSANPGEAIYATGRSRLRYWIGHLDRDWPVGTRLAKGAFLGKTIDQSGTDHGHVGINAEAYLGKGKQFKYGRDGNGPDYTLGAPTIRNQLLALGT